MWCAGRHVQHTLTTVPTIWMVTLLKVLFPSFISQNLFDLRPHVLMCPKKSFDGNPNRLFQPRSPCWPATGLSTPVPQIRFQWWTLFGGSTPVKLFEPIKISHDRSRLNLGMSKRPLIERYPTEGFIQRFQVFPLWPSPKRWCFKFTSILRPVFRWFQEEPDPRQLWHLAFAC